MTIIVDLSKQEYPAFNIEPENSIVHFKNKSFLFGKNGAGKSTLCKIIRAQFINDYDVHVFSGFNNVLVDEKLNAVVLGEDNISAKKELDSIEIKLTELKSKREKIETELKSLEWKETYIEEGIEKNSLYKIREAALAEYEVQKYEIEKFFRAKAKELKEYKNPQITKTSYSKIDFLNDISLSEVIDELKKEEYESTLNDKLKKLISTNYKIIDIDFIKLINMVNEISDYKIEHVSLIEEIKDNSDRKEFAKHGLRIHKSGDNCSFCGNQIKEDRIKKLESFISVAAIQANEDRINKQIEKINVLIARVSGIEELNKEIFYSAFSDKIVTINNNIKNKKIEYEYILNKLKDRLNQKAKSVFRTFNKLDVTIPESVVNLEKEINELIKRNNDWTKNIVGNQKLAKEKLRLHYVGLKLIEKKQYKSNWRGYEIENHELSKKKKVHENCRKDLLVKINELKGSSDSEEENTKVFLERKINKLSEDRETILKQTKNTYKLVETINTKLRRSGKINLELTLVKDETNIEHYQIKNGHGVRSIDKLSTGEKNIIGFLYFFECLSDIERKSNKKKIIVFDDPMNSNDDTMQYLIITEMQKLYTDKYRDKFNSSKDYFLCLTHNAHFYLNIQPHGHIIEKKIIDGENVKISKYDKNSFYRIEGGKVKRITSKKEDFNTHYEFLWIELKSLYSNDLLNSMLNSMRRIIETYIKFNKINQDKFYKNKEEHQKLFNVNSHSIDDHSMEIVGKDKGEIVRMFEALFISNNAKEHFETYWDIE